MNRKTTIKPKTVISNNNLSVLELKRDPIIRYKQANEELVVLLLKLMVGLDSLISIP